MPVSFTPLSRRPQRNNAPGVSRLSSLATLRERDGPFFDHDFRAFPASASVDISRAPASARRSPSPLTTTVGLGALAEACCSFAGAVVTVGSYEAPRTWN